jgi:hypothetical protein
VAKVNILPKQLKGPRKEVSRRSFLVFFGALVASASQFLRQSLPSWAGSYQPESSQLRALTPGAQDLHDLFKDEIRANFKNNVYATLGNVLQLDGTPYVKVSEALAAYDYLDIIQRTPIPEESRRKLMKVQIAKTETGLLDALASLDWPKFYVDLKSPGVNVSGPLNLSLYSHKGQSVIFIFHNFSTSPQTVRAESREISLPISQLETLPGHTRFLRGTVNPKNEEGDIEIKMRFATGTEFQDLSVKAHVEKTVLFEGLLVAEEKDSEPPIARVRITDHQGRYFAPEAHPSGLIRMVTEGQTTRGERWAYAKENFQVRVPLGKLRVSIRRGLEYRSFDTEIEVSDPGTLQRKFVLSRWANMEKDGWYPGDMHVHMLDPATALFECQAECLTFVNVMVFKHLDDVYAQEHFTGGVDPKSDSRHFIYYNEEFRNEPMGHVGLINLRKLVEPISTGRLGLHWPTVMRFDSLNMPLPLHGDKNSPDYPLLVQAMRQTHKQGGLVDWAHLRSSQWEFPLDAEEHQIDIADIMTHTDIPKDLELWYALLNCNFQIPACAGTDRIEATDPIGHQRVYVWMDTPLSYANCMKALKVGSSFVTNGPMIQLQVSGTKPGGKIQLSGQAPVSISASAFSQIPFQQLEIIVNGEIVRSVNATENGLSAEVTLDQPMSESAWIAARCMGAADKELFYSNPVFAHTNPVYVRYQDEPILRSDSAKLLLGLLRQLEDWAEHEGYFENRQQKEEVLKAIRSGMAYFERISLQKKG